MGKIAAEMQSYIGLLAREQVKVNIKNWKEVSPHVKELIWESVKVSVLSINNHSILSNTKLLF